MASKDIEKALSDLSMAEALLAEKEAEIQAKKNELETSRNKLECDLEVAEANELEQQLKECVRPWQPLILKQQFRLSELWLPDLPSHGQGDTRIVFLSRGKITSVPETYRGDMRPWGKYVQQMQALTNKLWPLLRSYPVFSLPGPRDRDGDAIGPHVYFDLLTGEPCLNSLDSITSVYLNVDDDRAFPRGGIYGHPGDKQNFGRGIHIVGTRDGRISWNLRLSMDFSSGIPVPIFRPFYSSPLDGPWAGGNFRYWLKFSS